MKKQKSKLLFFLLFIVSSLMLFVPLFFKDELRQLTSFGLVGLFLINFFASATVFLPAPGILSVAIGAQIYEPLSVAVISALGSSAGEAVSFVFGHSSKRIFNHKKKAFFGYVSKFTFKKHGTLLIFLLALIPNPVIDGLGILAGAFGYPLKKYTILVFLGRLVRNLILVYIH